MRTLSALAVGSLLATVASLPLGVRTAAAADRSLTISADDLGIGNHLALSGLAGAATIVVPAPHDLTPTHLTGTATLSLDGPSATLELRIDNQDVKVLNLQPGQSQKFDIALPNDGEQVVVGLKSLIGYSKTYCNGRISVPEVDLDDLAVGFKATDAAPSSVSTFLPSILQSATIWIPSQPSSAETAAASQLATGLTRLYGAQRVNIVIAGLGLGTTAQAHDFDPLQRDFVIRSAAAEGISFTHAGKAPVLLLGGKDPQLEASLAVSELRHFASGDTATTTGLTPDAELPAREQLLSDHGMSTAAVSGTGEISTTAHVTQSNFGGMTKTMTLHISGTHTPLTGDSNVVVSLLANGKLVASKRSGNSGKFSFNTTLHEPLLQRDNDFTVMATERSPGGPCSTDAEPIDLQVNGDSSVTAALGTSLPQGMQRQPQAFLPQTDLAFTSRDVSTVSAAITLLCAMQRLSSQPIDVNVVPVASIASSKQPAIVITDTGTKEIPVELPVSVLTGQITAVDLQGNKLAIAPSTPVLQMTAIGTRQIMVLSAGSALQLTDMADALTYTAGTFPGWTGDALVRDPLGVVHDVQVSDASRAPGYVPSNAKIPLWAVGSLGLIVVALVVAIALALRKRRSAS